MRLSLANGILAGMLWMGSDSLAQWLAWHWQARATHLGIIVAAGIFAYFFVLYLTGFGKHDLRPQGSES